MKKQLSYVVKKHWSVFMGVGLTMLLIGVVLGFAVAVLSQQPSADEPSNSGSINSFSDCANAGYPIQESFPEVCVVPGGKSFINN